MLRPPYQRYCFQVVLILFVFTAEKTNHCHGNSAGTLWCPSGCTCEWGVDVRCVSLQLSSIPLKLPEQTLTLNMANNKIRKVTNSSFEMVPMLRKLYLEHNHIQQLEAGVFQGLMYLEELHLQENNLIDVPPPLFHSLQSLTHLDLHKNALSFLDKDAFLYNQKLRFLDLQGNRFSNFAELPFHPLNQVTHLDLSYNPLVTLGDLTFNGLISLQDLQLVNVSLRSVQPHLLRPVQALQTLNLTANRIHHFKLSAIKFLFNLQNFDFSENPFKCDCHAVAFLNWIHTRTVFNWTNCCSPACAAPKRLQGFHFVDLVPQNLTCPKEKVPIYTQYWTYWSSRSVVNPKPLPYDKLMGWYTASTLSSMLVLFLIGVALDKAKRRFFRWRRAKRLERENMEKRKNLEAQQRNKRMAFKTNSINSNSTCRSYPIQDALNLATVSRQNSSLSPQTSLLQNPTLSRQNSFRSRQNSCVSSVSRQNSFVSPPSSYTSRQNSNDGDTASTTNYDINRQQNDISRTRNPLPKVKIHFAHNLHDFTKYTDPCEILKSQEAKNDVKESEMSESRVLLKWPSHTKLNELQEKVETTL